jgi:cathepsin C
MKYLSFVALIALLGLASCDTPANCFHNQTIGTWVFELQRADKDSPCTGPVKPETTMIVTLSEPDLAVASDGSKGFWTSIYNQGYEVRIAGKILFGFFNYTVDGSVVTSYCNQLGQGWAHEWQESGVPPRDWHCLTARQQASSSSSPNVHKVRRAVRSSKKAFSLSAEFVAKVKAAAKTWTVGDRPHFDGEPAEAVTKAVGGNRRSPRPTVPVSTAKLASVREAVEDQVYPAAHVHGRIYEDASQLPASFDWGAVTLPNGTVVDYLGPVRDQLNCGSCYSFATTSMLNARARIYSAMQFQDIFSMQDVLSCSSYSQGCNGGFPYLVSKYAADHGIVRDPDFPYSSGLTSFNPPCSYMRPNARKFFVSTDYKYVGGYFGACSSAAMALELVNRGPIAVSFEVYPDFLLYRDGVYQHTGVKHEDGDIPFELTNHSVLIVGYGVEADGTFSWTCVNSWGRHFGLRGGLFKILRTPFDQPPTGGECAIESMAEAARPLV